MNPVNKKWILFLLLFIIAVNAVLLLCIIIWKELYPAQKVIKPDSDTLALLERYLDIKIPESIQRISTCRNYEAGQCEWGTYLVFHEEDIEKMIDHDKWDLFSTETGGGKGFQKTFSVRYVWGGIVTWWNPKAENMSAIYTRNQNIKSYGHKIVMFIERPKQGWVRAFIILYADDKYFPISVGRFFEVESIQDVLIGDKYQEIEKMFKNKKNGKQGQPP